MIHEHALEELIGKLGYSRSLYYLWTGHMASDAQAAMLEACLVAALDHGPDALSTKTARMAASGGAELHAALAAGCAAAGRHHGTIPIRDASILLQDAVANGLSAEQIVENAIMKKKRLPGFGHRVYEIDPRTQALLRKAEELEMKDMYVNLALSIEFELERQKGKRLCLNIDGMIASLLPGLGISPELGQSLFLIGRLPGMAFHIAAQQKEKPASMREGNSSEYN